MRINAPTTMANFYVLVQGKNCWILTGDGRSIRYGFFQNHWISSLDADTAGKAAISRTRSDPRWSDLSLDSARDGMTVRVKEIHLVDSIDDVGTNPSGLNFYKAPRWWEFWHMAWWANLWPW